MKAFFIKHKVRILYWLIFISILFIFVPRQKASYLETDIAKFKEEYFLPGLFWVGAIICILLFLILFINTKSTRDSTTSFLYAPFITVFLLFTLKDIFLGGALFVNKLYKTNNTQKAYRVISVIKEKQEEETQLYLLDISTQKMTYDEKLKDKLYHQDLKPNDTVRLSVDIGLLGIAFPQE